MNGIERFYEASPLYGYLSFQTGLDLGWVERAPEVSRFSCMMFLSVRGLSDYAGPTGHSRFLTRPDPCLRFGWISRRQSQDSGPRWSRFLLS
jgi:hypothetical protein